MLPFVPGSMYLTQIGTKTKKTALYLLGKPRTKDEICVKYILPSLNLPRWQESELNQRTTGSLIQDGCVDYEEFTTFEVGCEVKLDQRSAGSLIQVKFC